MTRLRIDLEGLHGSDCAETLREALSPLRGVRRIEIDVDQGFGVVELEEALDSREPVARALEEAGFSVRRVERADARRSLPLAASQGGAAGYLVFALLVAALAVVGYAGYALYPRFDLPRADGAALLLLAAGAGIASFFSPCAFGLLATLLARRTGVDASPPGVTRPWTFATGLSLGAAAFVLLVGLGIGLGGAGLIGDVTFTSTGGRALRLSVGVLLVLLGLVQLELLPSPLHRVEAWARPLQRLSARERRHRPFVGHVLFGFGYLLAGFG